MVCHWAAEWCALSIRVIGWQAVQRWLTNVAPSIVLVEAGGDVLLERGSVAWLTLADEHALIMSIIKNMEIHRKIISFPQYQSFSLVNYTY
jgi:hypothetical protein